MRDDPRLADVTLLALAAKRRLATRQVDAWQHTEGLAALLEAAKRLPPRDPVADEDLPTTGIGGLLREARQRVPRERKERT
jgi:hypothetical protein